MIAPDVSVLINVFRRDSPQHALCRSWLTRIVTGDARFGISPIALRAVIRITTNRRAFKTPSPIEEAFGFCDDLLGHPLCEVIEPGERHWGIFRRLCVETATRGAHITDAWFAALAIEWGCEWITLDRDFARFPGLNWRVPSAR